MGVRISVFSHNSATLQFKVLTSMQMDAYLKKEQISTLFVWVVAPEGGVVGQGDPAQKLGMPAQNFFFGRLLRRPCHYRHFFLFEY
jgi:hypothetical protein